MTRLFAVGQTLQALGALPRRRPGLSFILSLVLLVPAALLMVLAAAAIAGRMGFPMAFDWLEGNQIYHAYRLLHGQAIYRLDTSGFLPHPYPPAHILLVAASGALFGLDYASARAVSVAAYVIAALVLTYQVWSHWPGRRGRVLLALVSAGYIAGTYGLVRGWYDIARVDSLALVFVILAAAPLAAEKIRWRDIVISALFASLAVYTKQTNVLFAAGLCVLVLRRDPRKGVGLALIMGTVCAVALLLLEHLTRGAFLTWLFNTRHHAVSVERLLEGAWEVLLGAPFLILVPFLLGAGKGRSRLSARAMLWLALLLLAIPTGLIPFSKRGGYLNSLMPIWFLAGPTILILIAELARSTRETTRQGILATVMIVQAVLLSLLIFDPDNPLPGAQERQRAQAMNRTIAGLKGGVVCPIYPLLPVRNGHRTDQASWISHTDAMWAKMPGVTASSYMAWLHGVRPRWLLLTDESAEEAVALLDAVGTSYKFHREIPAPAWGDGWMGHPVPRRLYRLVEVEAEDPPAVPER